MTILKRSVTVGELIEALLRYPKEIPIAIMEDPRDEYLRGIESLRIEEVIKSDKDDLRYNLISLLPYKEVMQQKDQVIKILVVSNLHRWKDYEDCIYHSDLTNKKPLVWNENKWGPEPLIKKGDEWVSLNRQELAAHIKWLRQQKEEIIKDLEEYLITSGFTS